MRTKTRKKDLAQMEKTLQLACQGDCPTADALLRLLSNGALFGKLTAKQLNGAADQLLRPGAPPADVD